MFFLLGFWRRQVWACRYAADAADSRAIVEHSEEFKEYIARQANLQKMVTQMIPDDAIVAELNKSNEDIDATFHAAQTSTPSQNLQTKKYGATKMTMNQK